MKTKLVILICSMLIMLSGCTTEPEISLEYVLVEKPVEIIKYVDRYQTITVTPETEIVTETVIEYHQLRDFESYQKLKDFIDNWTHNRLFVVANDAPNKCELWALECQRIAALEGYRINFQVTGFHAENSAIIGNEIYMIEPQTGDIRLWGYLD